ncbi:MAG: DNA primase [Desulfobacterales bacterium]
MTSFIPDEKIAEIRQAADIVDIVSGVVLLKKGGKNYLGLCPFHSEKTPSFTVSPDKQIFHCFGCGEGGDVFSFVMKQEGLSFAEAVRDLARRCGITLPERRMSGAQRRRLDENEQLLAVNRLAMDFFQKSLTDGPAGEGARSYLAKRGLTRATIEQFQIGFAPKGWDHLCKHLMGQNLPASIIEKSGLVLPRKNSGGYYDRFRERIMFPISDVNRRVIGFGGRVMDDALPKYLNSPETALYNKSRSLYGLHLAKAPCRESESVFIVEGYFDAVALHQHGLANTVATLGTSLTTEHVRLLRGCVGEKGRAVLVYDSDDAGIKAARRSIDVFDKEYVNAQILVLASGYDPDSFIFEYGADVFDAAAQEALDIIPFLLESAIKENGLSVEGRVRIVSKLKGPLNAVSDSVARSLYVRMVAERLEIDERALLEKLRQATGGSPDARRMPMAEPAVATVSGQRAAFAAGAGSRVEKQIIAMMLQVPHASKILARLDALALFEDPFLARLGKLILEVYDRWKNNAPATAAPSAAADNRWLADVMAGLADDADRRAIADAAIHAESWDLEGCEKQILHFVETARKRRSHHDIEHRIKAAVHEKDDKLVEQLLIEKQALAVKREKRKMALRDR